jgi:hypothetical protein
MNVVDASLTLTVNSTQLFVERAQAVQSDFTVPQCSTPAGNVSATTMLSLEHLGPPPERVGRWSS